MRRRPSAAVRVAPILNSEREIIRLRASLVCVLKGRMKWCRFSHSNTREFLLPGKNTQIYRSGRHGIVKPEQELRLDKFMETFVRVVWWIKIWVQNIYKILVVLTNLKTRRLCLIFEHFLKAKFDRVWINQLTASRNFYYQYKNDFKWCLLKVKVMGNHKFSPLSKIKLKVYHSMSDSRRLHQGRCDE